jgi:hypothetical protein
MKLKPARTLPHLHLLSFGKRAWGRRLDPVPPTTTSHLGHHDGHQDLGTADGSRQHSTSEDQWPTQSEYGTSPERDRLEAEEQSIITFLTPAAPEDP